MSRSYLFHRGVILGLLSSPHNHLSCPFNHQLDITDHLFTATWSGESGKEWQSSWLGLTLVWGVVMKPWSSILYPLYLESTFLWKVQPGHCFVLGEKALKLSLPEDSLVWGHLLLSNPVYRDHGGDGWGVRKQDSIQRPHRSCRPLGPAIKRGCGFHLGF